MNQAEGWNAEYLGRQSSKPVYDLWLDKYSELLDASKQLPVLDLGCGIGNNSLYLTERGYQVIGCDISEAAVAIMTSEVPSAKGIVVDMLDGLPFDASTFSVVIADLCLHYFTWKDTIRIVADIRRILKSGGVLLCRLNSTKDLNYGAGRGERLEANYYNFNGKNKRFFDRKQVDALFSDWETLYIGEHSMERYKKPKMLWEAALKKPLPDD